MIIRRKRNRRIVVDISDIHSGHRLGLLNPDTVLIGEDDDGSVLEWTPAPTQTQEYLWGLLTGFIADLVQFAGKDEIVLFHSGDATQGDKYPDGQIPGVTRGDQRTIAYYNLLPLVQMPNVKKARIITGTLSHVPNMAEARIARRLKDATGKDVAAFHHSRATVDGVIFDVAHHGPYPGSRDWLRGNVAMYYLKDRVYRDRRLGKEPARVYIRGHFHEWVRVTLHETWDGVDAEHDLTIVPSFCGLTRYAQQATKSEPSLTNGLCAYEIIEGRLVQILPFKATIDLRTEEDL